MAKRKKSWFQSLSKKERAHVRWALNGRLSLKAFLESRDKQKESQKEHGGSEPCWECWEVENKLRDKGFLK